MLISCHTDVAISQGFFSAWKVEKKITFLFCRNDVYSFTCTKYELEKKVETFCRDHYTRLVLKSFNPRVRSGRWYFPFWKRLRTGYRFSAVFFIIFHSCLNWDYYVLIINSTSFWINKKWPVRVLSMRWRCVIDIGTGQPTNQIEFLAVNMV